MIAVKSIIRGATCSLPTTCATGLFLFEIELQLFEIAFHVFEFEFSFLKLVHIFEIGVHLFEFEPQVFEIGLHLLEFAPRKGVDSTLCVVIKSCCSIHMLGFDSMRFGACVMRLRVISCE